LGRADHLYTPTLIRLENEHDLAVDRLSTTIWSGGAAAGLYLGTGLILALLVHTHYPGALGLREWIRVAFTWPLIFFLRSK
jgi:hypothetical protein